MNEFTHFELLLLNELVVREEDKYRKILKSDLRKNLFKIFRPGIFIRLQTLLDLELKINSLGVEAKEREEIL